MTPLTPFRSSPAPALFTGCLLTLAALSGRSYAALLEIGVSFTGRDGSNATNNTSYQLGVDDAAGVISQRDWNNLGNAFSPEDGGMDFGNPGYSNRQSGSLFTDDGNLGSRGTSTVTVAVSAGDSWNSDGSTDDPDHRLEKGIIKTQSQTTPVALTLSGLTAGSRYTFIAYTQENNNNGSGDISLTLSGAISYATYFATESLAFDGTYTRATGTSLGAKTLSADYAQWDAVTADSGGHLTLNLNYLGNGGDGAGLAGFQLVELPPLVNKYFNGGPGASTINQTNTNFRATNDAGASNAVFQANDTLNFGNLNGSGLRTITIDPAGLTPGAIFVNNAAGNDYNIGGGALGGAGALQKDGAGNLTLSGTNTYTGGTILNGGVTTLSSAGALGTQGSLFFGGGTLKFSAANTIDYSGRFSAGAGQLYQLDTNGQNVTLASAFSSAGGSLSKLGAGALTLGADNDYSGGTTIAGGTVAAGGGGLGTGALVVQAGTTLSVTGRSGLAGQYFDITPNQANFSSLSALQGHLGANTATLFATAASLNFGTSDTGYYSVNGTPGSQPGRATTFAGKYAGTGATNFEASFSGMMKITTAGSYTFTLNSDDGSILVIDGQTVVLDNNFQAANANAVQAQGTLTLSAGLHNIVVAVNQGTGGYGLVTQVSGPDTNNVFADLAASNIPLTPDLAVGSLAGAGNVALTTGGLIAGQDGTSTVFSGQLSGVGGLEKTGAGTLTLSGANTFAGLTSVAGGVLQVANASALQNSTVLVNVANSLLFATGVTSATLGGLGGTSGLVLQDGGASALALTVGGNNSNTTFSGVLSGPGSLTKAGTGTMILTATETYTGATVVNGGTLQANVGNMAGTLSGSGAIIINNGGTLASGAVDGLGYYNHAATNSITINPGGTLLVTSGGRLSMDRDLNMVGGTLASSGTTFDSNASYAFRDNQGASYNFTSSPAGVASTLSATHIGVDGVTFNVSRGGGPVDLNVTGDLVDLFGTGGIIKTGSGVMALSNPANTYTARTVISGGILNVASLADYGVASSLGQRAVGADNGGGDAVGLLFRGGTLQYTGSTPQSTNRALRISTVGGATLDASGSTPAATLSFTAASSPDLFENAGSRTLTLTGSNTGSNSFGLAITEVGGATSVTKTGLGTWLLASSASSYTGPTTITGGILRANVQGSLGATGSISVTNGGRLLLGGSGFAPAAATVTLGASLQPGALAFVAGSATATPFSQTFTSLTLGGDSVLDFGLGDYATFSLSALTLAGNALTVDHYSATGAYFPTAAVENGTNTDRLLTNTVFTDAQLSRVSFYNDSHTLLFSGGHEISYAGPSGTAYEIVPVPEPSPALALALTGGLAGLCRRRRAARV